MDLECIPKQPLHSYEECTPLDTGQAGGQKDVDFSLYGNLRCGWARRGQTFVDTNMATEASFHQGRRKKPCTLYAPYPSEQSDG